MTAGLRTLLADLQRLADYAVPLALRAVCELHVADHLAAAPRRVEDLAEATGTHPASLYRVLRALACRGVFTETEPGRFGLTPMGQLLRGDHPLSVRDAYPLIGADLRAWTRLPETLRTGRAAFEEAHGQGYYDYLADHPEDSARFDGSVRAQNALVLRALLSAYDWAECGHLVDVAGGDGTFLAGLLARFTSLRGTVFDLPHVVARAPEALRRAGVSDRCEVVSGSFFDAVPRGADTYLLKTILHDWDDRRAGKILRAVREAMRPDSTVLVLEALLPPGDEFHIGKLLDVHSLVLAGGLDRSEADYRELFAASGLAAVRIRPTPVLTVLEVRRDDT